MAQSLGRTIRIAVAAALLAACALAAAPAVAQTTTTPPWSVATGRFGDAHQIAISGEFQLSFKGTGSGELHLLIQPAADYFIIQSLSVGGTVGFQVVHEPGAMSHTDVHFILGARVGYNLNIIDVISFWPTAGVYYDSFGNNALLRVYAPFLFHIATHLFIGAGPLFELPLANSSVGYGLQSTVGGWF